MNFMDPTNAIYKMTQRMLSIKCGVNLVTYLDAVIDVFWIGYFKKGKKEILDLVKYHFVIKL